MGGVTRRAGLNCCIRKTEEENCMCVCVCVHIYIYNYIFTWSLDWREYLGVSKLRCVWRKFYPHPHPNPRKAAKIGCKSDADESARACGWSSEGVSSRVRMGFWVKIRILQVGLQKSRFEPFFFVQVWASQFSKVILDTALMFS